MRDPAREKPKIVFLYIGNETFSVGVDGRDPRRAVKHDGPLGGGVLMQLPDAAGSQSHVYTGQGFGNGQLPNCHLARPSAFVSPLVRKREWILEVLDQALRVCGRWPNRIRVLGIKPRVGWTRIAPAPICTDDFLQCSKAAYRDSGFADE